MEDWKGKNLKAIAILRVSSFRQKDNTSHDVQRKEIESYCQAEGLTLKKVFEFVESAKDSEARKKYKAAMEWALTNDARHIVFYMFDRETRNLRDNEENEKLVLQDRIVLHYARDHKAIHKDSSGGDFFLRDIQAAQNKDSSRKTRIKVLDSMKAKAEEGWFPSNSPPLGYLPQSTMNEEGKERKRGKIVGLDPDIRKQQQVIREFELRAKGSSYGMIRKTILEEGFIEASKKYQYHDSVVENRIKNPFYRGRFRWAGKEYQGKHELFIPEVILNAVDRTLYKKNFATKPITEDNALCGGWLICAHPDCGCNIVHEKKVKVSKTKPPKTYLYLHCTNGRSVHENMK